MLYNRHFQQNQLLFSLGAFVEYHIDHKTLRAEEKEIDSNRETLNPEFTNPSKYRHTLGHTPQKLKMLKILLDYS